MTNGRSMAIWFQRHVEWIKDEWCWLTGRPRHVVDLAWPMTEMFVVERRVPPSRKVVLWCAEHAPDRHRVIFRTSERDPGSMVGYPRLVFRREADMVLFRLRWSEELAEMKETGRSKHRLPAVLGINKRAR